MGTTVVNYNRSPIYIHGDAKTLKYMVKHKNKWKLNKIEYSDCDLQLALGCKLRSDCDLLHITANVVNNYPKNIVHIYSSPKIMKEIIENEEKNKQRDQYKYILIKCMADNKHNPLQLKCYNRNKHGRKYGEGI